MVHVKKHQRSELTKQHVVIEYICIYNIYIILTVKIIFNQ
jgi:hypothetical protein